MAWDSASNEMVLVGNEGGSGGQTWIWDGVRWLRQPNGDLPAGISFVGLATDPRTGAFLAVSCCAPGTATTSTWAWDGAAWHRLSTREQPLYTAAIALDPIAGRLLLCADPSLVAGREMWSWSGQDWTLLATARLPVFPQAEVSDTSDKRLVILGTFAQPTQGSPQQVHIWSWTGSTWTQLG
jgi:hypothetical protein